MSGIVHPLGPSFPRTGEPGDVDDVRITRDGRASTTLDSDVRGNDGRERDSMERSC